ncbi:DUF962 domain-containing protein [Caldimonas caldifontis]|uniref:DUF962 domain-containing protein n=1 Tax=Caldimonas caldifontis TaxID=1452508 RepID=A0A2S5SW11_9BURK|nr:Mpo1-like protein [Caldimonas caldifontis]PPE66950.1 hypothetical protein C1704_05705 [Caldimonas caldifontis]
MKTLVDQLAQYGAYHRDRRNILTHFVGIPMIVVAVTVLLARPTVTLGGLAVSPAPLVAALTTLYYLRLDLRYGVVMGVLLALSVAFAHGAAAGATATWLATGVGLFVVGWILQFIGHYFEGRKPAFVDDLMGLIIGPLFVVAEAGFTLGLRPEVQAAIEARCGPVRSV